MFVVRSGLRFAQLAVLAGGIGACNGSGGGASASDGGVVHASDGGVVHTSDGGSFPLNPDAAAAALAGDFYTDPALGITVTQFPWVFTPQTGTPDDASVDASAMGRTLTGLVTIAGMGAPHHVKVTEDDDYLDTGEVGTLSVDIVDVDMQNNGRTYVVSISGLSIEMFDLDAYGDGLGFYYNTSDGSYDINTTADAGMANEPNAQAAVQAILTDERFAGASKWGFVMAYAMGEYAASQLCADPANCPVAPPTCGLLPGLCECSVCAKLGTSTCPNCP